MNDCETINDGMKTKGLLGRWFWVWAALGAAILGLRLMTGGTDRQPASGDRIKGVTVTPEAPSADSVEELRRKRAEELQRERERQQLELEKEKLAAEKNLYVAEAMWTRYQPSKDIIRKLLDDNGGKEVEIIAKIENQSGIDNINEICEECDGIMIGRGDMGVEIPFEELPAVQKKLITSCRMLGKRVITATEMLESMIHNPRPTRAEISDVANAVYDGCSAIMLSGETAAGLYPVESVKCMAEIAEYTETQINYTKRFYKNDFKIKNTLDSISHATCSMAIDVDAKCIVVCSISGMTARMVSRFRCPVDIIGMTTDEKVWRKLALSWGVTPVMEKEFRSMDVMFYYAVENAKKVFNLSEGDNVVITGGMIDGRSGNTNTIKVEAI